MSREVLVQRLMKELKEKLHWSHPEQFREAVEFIVDETMAEVEKAIDGMIAESKQGFVYPSGAVRVRAVTYTDKVVALEDLKKRLREAKGK